MFIIFRLSVQDPPLNELYIFQLSLMFEFFFVLSFALQLSTIWSQGDESQKFSDHFRE